MKHIVCEAVPEGVDHLPNGATIFEGKLHFILDDDEADVKNAVYEARWDGRSDKLDVIKGDPSLLTMRYAGWPES